MKDVAIILVGLNSKPFVRDCLASIARADWSAHSWESIYVDNGSKDKSVEMVREYFPSTKVIANSRNLGYCKAANQGAAIAESRYYLFLNDDTIVSKDAIALLIDFLDHNPEAGVAGSRLLNRDGTDQWSGRRFPSPWNAVLGRRSILSRVLPNTRILSDYLYRDQLAAGVPFEADWVSAAAMMVRHESFRFVGGYAEDYYYWHEAVFCDRVRRAGQRVYLHPQSRIIHYEGNGSGARPYAVKRWHIINFHQGAYRCYCEHYNIPVFSPARWLTAAALGLRAAALLAATRIYTLR